MNEQEESLWRKFRTAGDKLKKGLAHREGGVKAEETYGNAYQALVQQGYAPQLRKRYRKN